MAHMHRSVATLRMMGDDLVPSEVSALLGAVPTFAQYKGQEIVTSAGRVRVAKFGQWRLEATDAEPENLDAQVEEILGKLNQDLSVWKTLGASFQIDLFCGWFMKENNEGVAVSPSTLQALGSRGITLALDIYGPTDDA